MAPVWEPFPGQRKRLLQDGGAIGGVGTEWAAALPGLIELVGLAEILKRVGKIYAVVIAACTQGEPGINAEGTTVSAAGACSGIINFRLATKITDRGKLLRRRTIGKAHRFDLDGRSARP